MKNGVWSWMFNLMRNSVSNALPKPAYEVVEKERTAGRPIELYRRLKRHGHSGHHPSRGKGRNCRRREILKLDPKANIIFYLADIPNLAARINALG